MTISPQSGDRGLERLMSQNLLYCNRKVEKKSLGVLVYLPQGGARGLERLACLKYYNVWKYENRLTLVFNATENTDYMKKKF